jgi:hypothetical protein
LGEPLEALTAAGSAAEIQEVVGVTAVAETETSRARSNSFLATLPIWVAAILTIYFSSVGTEPIALGYISVVGMVVVIAVTGFLWTIGFCTPTSLPRTSASLLASLTIWLTAVLFQWPLRVSFTIVEPTLERMAISAKAGSKITIPQQIGLFSVKEVEAVTYDGPICFWTDLAAGGRTGLIYDPLNRGPKHPWSAVRLNRKWLYLSED